MGGLKRHLFGINCFGAYFHGLKNVNFHYFPFFNDEEQNESAVKPPMYRFGSIQIDELPIFLVRTIQATTTASCAS